MHERPAATPSPASADFAEMQRAIRLLNDRRRVREERRCSRAGCPGTIRRINGRNVCDSCPR